MADAAPSPGAAGESGAGATLQQKSEAKLAGDHDAYHQVEILWRGVRDYESLHEEAERCVWHSELLQDPSTDPRCRRLVNAPSEAYELVGCGIEGIFLLPSFLDVPQQQSLLEALLQKWAFPPNRSNLWPLLVSDAEIQEGLTDFVRAPTGIGEGVGQFAPPAKNAGGRVAWPPPVVEKLRWVTLGRQYDWTTRTYLPADVDGLRAAPELPGELASLAEAAVASVPLPAGVDVKPFEAAIANLYHAAKRPSDRLGGHQDDVEENASSPLVTFSLGLPCVFLLGGETRSARPTPVLLRGGSALVLAGRARHAYHGVPTVLVPPKLQPRGSGAGARRKRRPEAALEAAAAKVYRPWASGTRHSHENTSHSASHVVEASMDKPCHVGVASDGSVDGSMEQSSEDGRGLQRAVGHLLERVRVSFSIRSVSG